MHETDFHLLFSLSSTRLPTRVPFSTRKYPPSYVSNSQLTLFRECPQKWAFRYLYPNKEEGDMHPSAALSSTLLHPALSALLSNQEWNTEEWWKESKKYIDALPSKLEPVYTPTLAQRLVEHYKKEQYNLDRNEYTVLDTESSYLLKFSEYSDSLPYLSIPDALLLDKEGNRWVLDWKLTTREQSSTYLLPYLEQQVGQCLATNAVGWLISCFLISLPRKKDGAARVGITHTRYKVKLRKDHARQWIQQTKQDLLTISSLTHSSIFSRHSSSCFSWGKPCSYLVTCSAGEFANIELKALKEEALKRNQIKE